MKKTLLAAAIVAMMPITSHALVEVGAKASIWNAEATGQIDSNVSVEKDGLNLKSSNGTQLTVYLKHPIPVLPNLKLKSTTLDTKGNGSLNASFADQTFNEAVSSKIDLSHTDATLFWTLPIPMVDIDLGLTARMFDGDASVTGNTAGTEAVDLDMTLPMGYAAVRVGLPFNLYVAGDANYIGFGKNKMLDYNASVGYVLPVPIVNVGVELGYRSFSLETDKKDVDIETDLDVKGLFYGASLSFGF